MTKRHLSISLYGWSCTVVLYSVLKLSLYNLFFTVVLYSCSLQLFSSYLYTICHLIKTSECQPGWCPSSHRSTHANGGTLSSVLRRTQSLTGPPKYKTNERVKHHHRDTRLLRENGGTCVESQSDFRIRIYRQPIWDHELGCC
jgi:hypothetical protein